MNKSNKTFALALAAVLLTGPLSALDMKGAPSRAAGVKGFGPLQNRAGMSFAPLKTGGVSLIKGLDGAQMSARSVIPNAASAARQGAANGAPKASPVSVSFLQKAANWLTNKKDDKDCPNPDGINDPVERRYEDGRDTFDGSGEEERRSDSPVSSDIEGKGPYGPSFLNSAKALKPSAKVRRGSTRAVRAPDMTPSGPTGPKEPGMLQAVQTVLEASVVAATAYATHSPAATYSALVLVANLHYYPKTLKEMSSGNRTLGIVSNMLRMGKMTAFSNPLSLVMDALPAYAVVGKAAVMTITHPVEVMGALAEKLAAGLKALAAATVTLSKASAAAVLGGLFGAFVAAVTLTPEVLYAPVRPVVGIVTSLFELIPAKFRKPFLVLSGTAAAVVAAYHIVPVMSFLASAMLVIGTVFLTTFKGTALLGAAMGAPVAWAESSRGGIVRGVQKAFAAVIEFVKKVENKVRPS